MIYQIHFKRYKLHIYSSARSAFIQQGFFLTFSYLFMEYLPMFIVVVVAYIWTSTEPVYRCKNLYALSVYIRYYYIYVAIKLNE